LNNQDNLYYDASNGGGAREEGTFTNPMYAAAEFTPNEKFKATSATNRYDESSEIDC